jgi:Fic family protein
LGRLIPRRWVSDVAGLGTPKRDAARGRYFAYLPDPLKGQRFSLDGETAAAASAAHAAIASLDSRATVLTDTEALARLLLRAESVASSHIEGLRISAQRLLRADIELAAGATVNDSRAVEVLANVDAMSHAVTGTGKITVDRLREVHRRLLAPTRAARYAGELRTEQNWIGGSDFNPIGADFVPPPPEYVPALLRDLCEFCNGHALPAVVQAAIAHASFETIHPFADGNGRTGRALIYMVMRKRALAVRTTPPISLVLAPRSKDYVRLLNATRSLHPRGKPSDDSTALNRWIAFFSDACVRAVEDAEQFEQRVAGLQTEWRGRLSGVRGHSTVFALLRRLPAAPVITVKGAADLTGRTFAAANNAVEALVRAKILTPTRTTQRNRTFEARELLDAFTALERKLASPARDTRLAKPIRDVPAKPRR